MIRKCHLCSVGERCLQHFTLCKGHDFLSLWTDKQFPRKPPSNISNEHGPNIMTTPMTMDLRSSCCRHLRLMLVSQCRLSEDGILVVGSPRMSAACICGAGSTDPEKHHEVCKVYPSMSAFPRNCSCNRKPLYFLRPQILVRRSRLQYGQSVLRCISTVYSMVWPITGKWRQPRCFPQAGVLYRKRRYLWLYRVQITDRNLVCLSQNVDHI